jgi:Helix-destabilising protein
MRLKVKSTQVFERKIHSSKNNKDYTFREQEALVSLGEETRIIVLSLEEGQVAFAPGEYEVLDSSFEVDRNRALSLKRRLALRPVEAVKPVASAVGQAR